MVDAVVRYKDQYGKEHGVLLSQIVEHIGDEYGLPRDVVCLIDSTILSVTVVNVE